MRIYIRTKIFILGFGLTLVLVLLAFMASFFSYKSRVESKYEDSVKLSLSLTSDWLSDIRTEESYSTSESRSDVFNYIVNTYNDLVSTDKNYPSETADNETIYNYLKTYYSDLYPNESGAMGMSRTGPLNRAHYSSLKSDMVSAISVADGYMAEIVYYDTANDRYLSICNTLFKFDDPEHLGTKPGSYKQLSDYDHKIIDTITKDGYYREGSTRIYFCDIKNTDKLVARIILYYDTNVTAETIRDFARILAFALLLISALLVISYVFFAHVFIVKNIKKLTATSNKFKDDLLNDRELEVIKTDIKANDEIGILSDSFEMLEKDIIDYIKKIDEETTRRLKMESEIEVAAKIQLGGLPNKNYFDEKVRIFASITQAKEVGGDFYDYFYIDDTHFAVIVADVSGKGVPASLFMMKTKELIKGRLLSKLSLSETLFEVNNEILINNQEGLFVTVFLGVIDLKNYKFRFINAGHEKPFIIHNDKVEKMNTKSNFVVGGIENFKYEEEEITINKDDRLFIYTDGLNEAINQDNEEFGYDRILHTLEETLNKKSNHYVEDINEALKKFVGDNEPFDDVTLLNFRFSKPKINLEYKNPGFEVIEEVTNIFNNEYGFINNKKLSEADIIIDELLNNFVSYEKRKNLIINVEFLYKDNSLFMTFMNNGDEFNPLNKEEKYVNDASVEAGGLGITIIKNLSDEISYERKDGYNILKIIKK